MKRIRARNGSGFRVIAFPYSIEAECVVKSVDEPAMVAAQEAAARPNHRTRAENGTTDELAGRAAVPAASCNECHAYSRLCESNIVRDRER